MEKDKLKELFEKFLNMSREEEIKFMSECINGKQVLSDYAIAFGLALKHSEPPLTTSENS